jgi:hypothetical protein
MIRVRPFQPFSSRVGVDTVAGLEFPYDPALIDTLKSALRSARWRLGRGNVAWLWGQPPCRAPAGVPTVPAPGPRES